MTVEETQHVVDYFHSSTAEHLEMLGVDPTRLPTKAAWADRFLQIFASPLEKRAAFYITWLNDQEIIGFSSCDKIQFGGQAHMHLHLIEPNLRRLGAGTECVRQSVEIYFKRLEIKRLIFEPNSFNTGPNRALQNAGFKYVKTHMTVPGPLNFHQAVTRWMIER